jgi:spore germination cell wall hydrolase CwlJ-like protein
MVEILNQKLKIFVGLLLLSSLLFTTTTQTQQDNSVPEINFAKVDTTQLACMAKNIFYEAGSESINGQAAVARVVMNRVKHGFANTPCNVVYQKTIVDNKTICQFSWVCEGKGEPNRNNYKYRVAQQVAYDVLVLNKYQDVVPNSTLFFHSININPVWPHRQVAVIGSHVFYAKIYGKKITKPKIKDAKQSEIQSS